MALNLEIGSVFSPASPMAEATLRLLYLLLVLGTGVLAIIAAVLVISAIRFRDRGRDVPEGNERRRLEVFWILGAAVLLLVVLVPTVHTMRVVDPPPGGRSPVVIGHQFWWEFRYPASGAVAANEIHIPVGRPWLVLRHGVSEPPKAGRPVDPRTYRAWYHETMQREGVPFFPDSAWRDALFAVGVVVIVAVLAALVGAPELGKPPDPSLLASAPRPDWYLLWTFSLFALLPPSWENYFIVIGPALAAIVLFIIPLWNRGERSPARRPWAVASVIAICLMVGTLWIAGITSPWAPDFSAQPLPKAVVGAAGGPVAEGANLFYNKGCEFCHAIAGHGGLRGPDLTTVGDRLTPAQMTWRIMSGGTNMPALAGNLTPEELNALIAFLRSRTAPR